MKNTCRLQRKQHTDCGQTAKQENNRHKDPDDGNNNKIIGNGRAENGDPDDLGKTHTHKVTDIPPMAPAIRVSVKIMTITS